MLLYTLYFVEVYFILFLSILLTKCTQTSHKILYTLVLAYRLSLDIPYQKRPIKVYHAVNHYLLIKELWDVGVSCCKPLCIDKGALGRWCIML